MTRQVRPPKSEPRLRDLTSAELDHVTGGGSTAGSLAGMGDGSVRPGDFNGGGDVDGRDFLLWRKTSG